MVPGRLRLASGLAGGRNAQLTSLRFSPLPYRSRAYSQLRTPNRQALSQRVQLLGSRAPLSRQAQFFTPSHNVTGKRNFHKFFSPNVQTQTQILESRFPRKTFLAVLLLSVVVYYSDIIGIEIDESWQARVFQVFGELGVTPLHFFPSREELDHWIQHHIPDPNAALKDPEFFKSINANFEKMAFGWELSEEDAIEVNMPLTHGCRFRSNSPCEDYFAFGTSPGPGEQLWNFWSVFDGHAGQHTAQYLQWHLHPEISRALLSLHSQASSETIENCIRQTFVRIDNDMMNRAKHAGNWFPAANASAISALTPAFSGSCALMAAFDPTSSKLRVACTGDSRAVLGRWDPLSEKYTCIPLSVDQTGFNELEVARLTEEHPDEDGIIDPKSGRLLGIAVTRAFGDHRWKWDNDFIKQMQIKFWGSSPRPGSKTPPYMTAEPVVTETEIVRVDAKGKSEGKSDFMIMASDGLWDRISSEHAVECVQRWLEAKARGNGLVSADPQRVEPVFPTNFTLDEGVTYDVEKKEELDWKATPEYFAIEDENAAICLAKNAMGGTRKGLFIGILSVASPQCRYAVDDTTIMVVFFDKIGKEGERGIPLAKKEKRWWWPFGSSAEKRG
jgi:pyruvate dehydrogenase phosphatase